MERSRKINWKLVGRKIDQQFANRNSTLWGCLALLVFVGAVALFLTAPYWIHLEPIKGWVEEYLRTR